MPNSMIKNVAVVDDDPAMLESLQFLLEAVGYKVGVYSSAIAFLKDCAARPACLITDLNMPEMTGLELTAHLRTNGSCIPVLLFSAQVSATVISHPAQIGINKVVEKPAPDNELLSFVASHICKAA